LGPVARSFLFVHLDLSQRQFLRVSVSHYAYFMSKSCSFIFVWHHLIYNIGHWAYNAAK
jgi:hypothetical protein